jgi:L-cysteine desulfidase
MKKLLFGLIASVMVTSLSLGQEKLEEKIAKSDQFINMQKINETILSMKKSDVYIKEFDSKTLNEKGESYLSDISGFNVEELSNFGNQITEMAKGVINEFPELNKMTKEELALTIENATNIYIDQHYSKISAACLGCKRKGLSSMSNQTFLGLLAGGTLGGPFAIWSGWIGATLGFWQAAEEALDCIRVNCK